jgi:dihydrofolate reductase
MTDIAIIAALADNRVIGRNNRLPWQLPGDLQYFRAMTMGKPVIMGRKTFESLKQPLAGRTNIVVTRNPDWSAAGVRVVHSLEAALQLAENIALIDGVDEVMIIGGEEIYRQCLPWAQRMYLTRVHRDVSGDAWFPAWDTDAWVRVSEEVQLHENLAYTYEIHEKKDIYT